MDCYNCCKEVIEPSIKLDRMIKFLKTLYIFHIIIILIDIMAIQSDFIFCLFIQETFLIIGISSKYFAHYLIYINICIINLYYIFQKLGIWAQKGFYKNNNIYLFCFYSFILIFEIFCIYVLFQAYKQSKYEYKIKLGYVNEENENIPNNQHFQENNRENNNDNINDNIDNDRDLLLGINNEEV